MSHDLARALHAADRLDIVELAAAFDNALDAEDREKFVGTFEPEGVLAGFWGEAKGRDAIRGAFDFMLSTFARGRRHFVGNHEVKVEADEASMFLYMVVFDRASNSSIGTATFTDRLRRTGAGWRFERRTLAADPNVNPILAALER